MGIKNVATNSEGSFKSENTNMQINDLIEPNLKEKSFLKKLGSIPGFGVFLGALSAVCFATGSLCTRLLADEQVNSNQMVIGRSLIQLVVYLIVSYWKKGSLLGESGERLSLFQRAIFGFISLAGNYMAIQTIGLSESASIVFSAPVFTVFFAFFLINEPIRCVNMLTLVLVMFGIILICRPELLFDYHKVEVISGQARLQGSIIAFVACLANAMTYISLRKLKKTSSQVSIIWYSIVSIVFSSILNALFFDFNLPQTRNGWFIMFLTGVCGVFGQLFLTISLKIAEAGPVSMARTMDIVMSFIYQVTILNEPVETHTVIGAILIVIGVIITSVGMTIFNKIKKCCTKKNQTDTTMNQFD